MFEKIELPQKGKVQPNLLTIAKEQVFVDEVVLFEQRR
jgi:hypothetical protein